MKKATQAQSALRKVANAKKAAFFPKFFKTGPGEYGYGDQFIGVSVPDNRAVAKNYLDLSLSEIKKLLQSKIHEDRLLGLIILVEQFEKAEREKDQKLTEQIYRFYLANFKSVNNWDLVDSSAPVITGRRLLNDKSKRKLLFKWVRSKNLWERRIAVLSTFALLREGQFNELLKLSELLLNDKEDLMHKAVGWMLREAGKRDVKVLKRFLNQHAHRMPRTMLRYSLEKLTAQEKKHYMKMGSK